MTSYAQLLAQSGLPLLEARMLLEHLSGKNSAWQIAHGDEAVAAETGYAFAELVRRRTLGEPMAYLLGAREFYGLELHVTPAVLIPRPETELLVELALARIPQDRPVRVLDLGTGSGAVAVALAKLRPQAQVTAVDLEYAALGVARENARRHKVRVRFFCGDWFGPLPGERFDLIVSNPPYVAAGDDHLARGDLRFEPRRALDGGDDGLQGIRAIAAAATSHLHGGAWLLLEHGYDQAPACCELLRRHGYQSVRSWTDLGGRLRVSGGAVVE